MNRPPLAGLLALSLLAPVLRAGTLVVPDDFATIQAAIDAAVDGDQILIKPGVYAEQLVVTGKTGLVLRGQGKAVVRPATSQVLTTALSLDGGSDIVVQSLAFERANTGLLADGVAGLQVLKCSFTKCGEGNGKAAISVAPGAGATVVDHCALRDCLAEALDLSSPDPSATVSITDNLIETLGAGIKLSSLSQAQVSGNTIRAFGLGLNSAGVSIPTVQALPPLILVSACSTENVVVEGNLLLQGGRGIVLLGCVGPRVSANQIKDAVSYGIQVDDSCANVTLDGNTILNAGLNGIRVMSSTTATNIVGNVVKKAFDTGMFIDGTGALCKDNTISQCAFDGLYVRGDSFDFIHNVITGSGRVGLILSHEAQTNSLSGNVVTGSRAYDFQDLSTGTNLFADNTFGTTAP